MGISLQLPGLGYIGRLWGRLVIGGGQQFCGNEGISLGHCSSCWGGMGCWALCRLVGSVPAREQDDDGVGGRQVKCCDIQSSVRTHSGNQHLTPIVGPVILCGGGWC